MAQNTSYGNLNYQNSYSKSAADSSLYNNLYNYSATAAKQTSVSNSTQQTTSKSEASSALSSPAAVYSRSQNYSFCTYNAQGATGTPSSGYSGGTSSGGSSSIGTTPPSSGGYSGGTTSGGTGSIGTTPPVPYTGGTSSSSGSTSGVGTTPPAPYTGGTSSGSTSGVGTTPPTMSYPVDNAHRELSSLGYDIGEVNGYLTDYGKDRSAIARYQHEHGLEVTTFMNDETERSIHEEYIKSQTPPTSGNSSDSEEKKLTKEEFQNLIDELNNLGYDLELSEVFDSVTDYFTKVPNLSTRIGQFESDHSIGVSCKFKNETVNAIHAANKKLGIGFGVYENKRGTGLVNSNNEKLYVQWSRDFGQKYGIMPPLEVPDAIYEAPASLLKEKNWKNHYVLMTENQWQNTRLEKDTVSNSYEWLDETQTVLDFAGMVPVVGEAFDGVNGIIYWARGDKVNALLSAGAMIPFAGDGVTALKLTEKGAKYADEIINTGKYMEKVGSTGQVHHLLSNKTMKALNNHDVLKGVFQRNDAKFMYRASTPEAHKGYEKWHRAVDKETEQWLNDHPQATEKQFKNFLNEIYNRPGIKERIPGVNIE